ncbi:MAG: type II toxin-antitoxin system PemK/MazF family toxin [Tumebacillaceae bacterium]
MTTLENVLEAYFQLSEGDRYEALQAMMLYLDETSYQELVKVVSNLHPDARTSLLKNLTKTIPIEPFRKAVTHMAEVKKPQVLPEMVHDTFERIFLYAKSAKNQYEYEQGTRRFKVQVKKRCMIHVDFSGLGSEHKGNHPAIVWDVEASRDHLVVIPCTSYKSDTTVENESTIDIGPARFFDSAHNVTSQLAVRTVVLLDQIQPISRKRITFYRTRDPSTNQLGIARIGQDQVERIEEGLRIFLLGEKTFFEKELLNVPDVLPECITTQDQYLHMHRCNYTVLSDDGYILSYQVAGDERIYVLLRRLTALSNSKRKELLRKWNRPKARKDAQGNVLETTPQVRQRLYELLQSHYLQTDLHEHQDWSN